MKRITLLLFVLCIPAACTQPDVDTDITKEEARNLGGKADGLDLCELLGWYGDGICDEFCSLPDPDCQSDEFCTSDSECGPNNHCSTSDGECLPYPCPDGLVCPAVCAGTCVPDGPDACWGAWMDENGTCRAPNDGVYPEDCCLTKVCGGFAGFVCGDGEYCDYEESEMCGGADQLGECKPLPEACIEIFAPVCGCDGQDYSNSCYANAAGTSVAKTGACEPEPNKMCGGFLGLMCGDGDYCHYEESEMCGAADQLGECKPLPEACIEIFAPVCGCDGQSYSNNCHANSAGTSVAHIGDC